MLLVVDRAEGDEIRAQVRRVEQNRRPADTWQDDSKKGERGEDNFGLPPRGKTKGEDPSVAGQPESERIHKKILDAHTKTT